MIKKFLWVLIASLAFIQAATGQAKKCSDFNTSIAAIAALEPFDVNQHSGLGVHAWGLTPVAACTYTPGSNTPNCNVSCDVVSLGSSTFSPAGGTITVENGQLTAPGVHMVSGGWNPGHSVGVNGGTSCQATLNAGAVNCFGVTSTCFFSVTVNAGGTSFSTNGVTVWDSKPIPVANKCPAEADPQAPKPTPTPAPVQPPPPCDPDNPPVLKFGNGQDGNAPNPCDSPIIIDLTGNGFALTDAAHGVLFDIEGTGVPKQIAWIANSNNAWLVLDRDGNGQITSGAEMFGNFTNQNTIPNPNGFNALKLYDDPANGGNGDGIIDLRDQIFSKLRLWVDANHDGICQPGELHPLPDLGVYAISLDYTESKQTDQFGNVFRYSARINPGLSGKDNGVGRKAYDVFLRTQ